MESLSPNFCPAAHSSPQTADKTSRHSSVDQSACSLPSKDRNIRFLSINCNGVASKKAELENLISYTHPDVLCISETKLDDTVHTSEFLPSGYVGFRKDRVRGGGGVMVAVKETLPACDIVMDDVTGEVCWVRIDTKDNPLYVGAFYRTPSDRSLYQLEQLDKSLDNIAKLTRNNAGSTTVLAGDFNAGGVDWEAGVVPPGTNQSFICQKVLDICLSHGLEQQQRLPTREGRVLDLFCTNKP